MGDRLNVIGISGFRYIDIGLGNQSCCNHDILGGRFIFQ